MEYTENGKERFYVWIDTIIEDPYKDDENADKRRVRPAATCHL